MGDKISLNILLKYAPSPRSIPNTIKHEGKIRLHMIITLF